MKFKPMQFKKLFDSRTIYMPDGPGGLSDALDSIHLASTTLGETLTMSFNGTLVTVTPQMSRDQVSDSYSEARESYQQETDPVKKATHPALCPSQKK